MDLLKIVNQVYKAVLQASVNHIIVVDLKYLYITLILQLQENDFSIWGDVDVVNVEFEDKLATWVLTISKTFSPCRT